MKFQRFLVFSMLLMIGCLNTSKDAGPNQSLASDNTTKTLKKELEAAREERNALAGELSRRLEAEKGKLINPSWKELLDFLVADETDKIAYVAGEFDCNGFALRIRDNAQLRGYRSAYVFVGFQEKHVGHALNRFQLDSGELVYVDGTSSDTIAYVTIGKPYIRIPFRGVKQRYSRCADSQCLSVFHEDFSGSLFGMEYALTYQQRVVDYLNALERLNSDKRNFNQKSAFHRTSRELAFFRLREENLEQVLAHLGDEIYKNEEIVSSSKEFWN